MMIDFRVDEDKCTECNLCAQDCPAGIIRLNPKPAIRKEEQCIRCQHCLAICPTAAISILGKQPENSLHAGASIANAEDLSNLIKLRRSVRRFKQENIELSLIHELIQKANYAPTGHNKNKVRFGLVSNMEQMKTVKDKFYEAIKKAVDTDALKAKYASMKIYPKLYGRGTDIIFRDAPHMLVCSAPAKGASPQADSFIAMSYFELLANAEGIGTLWNGMAMWVAEGIAPEIQKELGIPEDHELGYIMVFGKSAVKYPRAIQNDEVWVDEL